MPRASVPLALRVELLCAPTAHPANGPPFGSGQLSGRLLVL